MRRVASSSSSFCFCFHFVIVIVFLCWFICFVVLFYNYKYQSYIYKTSGFDYRPFVLNWCMTVKVIDGFVVNPIESLKAEWLYSQGRGRQFRIGEQVELARYLSQVCPMSGEALEKEDERKLRLILSKAQQHQRQLQEEISGRHFISLKLVNMKFVCLFGSPLYFRRIQYFGN